MRRIGVLSTVLLLASGSAVWAQDSPEPPAGAMVERVGTLVMFSDPQVRRLVIVDTEQRTVSTYAVSSDVRMLGVESLDADPTKSESVSEPAVAKDPRLATGDVPGQDPPGVPRLRGSTRIAFAREDAGNPEERSRWSAIYLVEGDVRETYGRLRDRLADWTIVEENVKVGSQRSLDVAGFDLRRDASTAQIGIRTHSAPDGYVVVKVNVEQPAG